MKNIKRLLSVILCLVFLSGCSLEDSNLSDRQKEELLPIMEVLSIEAHRQGMEVARLNKVVQEGAKNGLISTREMKEVKGLEEEFNANQTFESIYAWYNKLSYLSDECEQAKNLAELLDEVANEVSDYLKEENCSDRSLYVTFLKVEAPRIMIEYFDMGMEIYQMKLKIEEDVKSGAISMEDWKKVQKLEETYQNNKNELNLNNWYDELKKLLLGLT